jgi:hypothetical protein
VGRSAKPAGILPRRQGCEAIKPYSLAIVVRGRAIAYGGRRVAPRRFHVVMAGRVPAPTWSGALATMWMPGLRRAEAASTMQAGQAPHDGATHWQAFRATLAPCDRCDRTLFRAGPQALTPESEIVARPSASPSSDAAAQELMTKTCKFRRRRADVLQRS